MLKLRWYLLFVLFKEQVNYTLTDVPIHNILLGFSESFTMPPLHPPFLRRKLSRRMFVVTTSNFNKNEVSCHPIFLLSVTHET